MTPFAQLQSPDRYLQKSAALPSGKLLRLIQALRDFGSGAVRAPGDVVSAVSGTARGGVRKGLEALSERSMPIAGNAAAEAGNIAGHGALASGALAGGAALGQRLSKKD